MAGHIDHGKTTLTKALTGVDTDHLKEEKEREISIEPGFASLVRSDAMNVSLIDVPGHERFIRQMIAGVAGIDFVILVIAADEGMMPQTLEHLAILSLLGIEQGVIALTKVDTVDDELLTIVKEDVFEQMTGTFLEDAPVYEVDSVTGRGVENLKDAVIERLARLKKKETDTPFRLPIDHVFTVKGQGVIVRGTVYNGQVEQGEPLIILPGEKSVRVRQIQSHRSVQTKVSAGQRAAFNVTGVAKDEIVRGDVLVADQFYTVTDRIDVSLQFVDLIKYPLKQRQIVKVFIGTSEVMGKIIFFDRNDVKPGEVDQIVCQIELDEEVVTTRGDRFILRRPSPAETFGGGWVIEPSAMKHRFGIETIEQLRIKKEGTLEDRLTALVNDEMIVTKEDILQGLSIDDVAFERVYNNLVSVDGNTYTLPAIIEQLSKQIKDQLKVFHDRHPLRVGKDKAEIISQLKGIYSPVLVEFTIDRLERQEQLMVHSQFISLQHFSPMMPKKYELNMQQLLNHLIDEGVQVPKWEDLVEAYKIPSEIQDDFYHYLLETGKVYVFDEGRIIAKQVVQKSRVLLAAETNNERFTLQIARDILSLSRKNLIPLLELFDSLGYTRRVANEREWTNKHNE